MTVSNYLEQKYRHKLAALCLHCAWPSTVVPDWAHTQEEPSSFVWDKETFTAAFLNSSAFWCQWHLFKFISFFSSEKQLSLHQEQHYRNVTFQCQRCCNTGSWKSALQIGWEIRNFFTSRVACISPSRWQSKQMALLNDSCWIQQTVGSIPFHIL